MEVKHEEGHYLKVKFDWIEVNPGTSEISLPQTDTGFLKDWTLLQIEGEDPVPVEETLVEVTQNKPGGKAAPAKKADPKKNQKTVTLEEITEKRPMTVKFERDCALEANGEGLEITEEVAIKFS